MNIYADSDGYPNIYCTQLGYLIFNLLQKLRILTYYNLFLKAFPFWINNSFFLKYTLCRSKCFQLFVAA